MKFTCRTEIAVPVAKAFGLFMDKNNLKNWQTDFKNYEHISGTPGEAGAVTKLVYKTVTMYETITEKNAPNLMGGDYEHKRGEKIVMIHHASHRFTSVNENTTSYEMEMEMVQIFGFLPKLMMSLMGGVTKKYYLRWLDRFKAFAETAKN